LTLKKGSFLQPWRNVTPRADSAERSLCMAEYVPAGHIKKLYVVSNTTLRKWADGGRIGRLKPGARSRNLYRRGR
jgi:hypothetical protein